MAHLLKGTNIDVVDRLEKIAEKSIQKTGFFHSKPDLVLPDDGRVNNPKFITKLVISKIFFRVIYITLTRFYPVFYYYTYPIFKNCFAGAYISYCEDKAANFFFNR